MTRCTNRPGRWPRSRPGSIRPSCRTRCGEKLGWLLLDHLRVCSIGARLPWSDWSRRYVGLVGKAGASHVLFSRGDASIRSTPPCSTSPSVRASTATTPMSAPCCIRAWRPGRRRWRSAEHAGASGPEVLAAVVAGYETIIRIGLSRAAEPLQARLPEHRHLRRLRHRGRRGAAAVPRQGRGAADRRRARDCRRPRQRAGAVLLLRRLGQAHPRRACGRGRRRGGACWPSRATAGRTTSSKGRAALPAPMPMASIRR